MARFSLSPDGRRPAMFGRRPERIGRAVGWRVGESAVSAQERVDDLQNKLACVICNAEVMLEMVDSAARERVEAILRSAWRASDLLTALPVSPVPGVVRPG
jgi:hypothetical protein